MLDYTKHIGLDVHKATIAVAVADEGRDEARSWGTIAHRPTEVANLVRRLAESGQALRFYYKAGPCGYGLYRQLVALGHGCDVVAPSLIPRRAGGWIGWISRSITRWPAGRERRWSRR